MKHPTSRAQRLALKKIEFNEKQERKEKRASAIRQRREAIKERETFDALKEYGVG